MIAMHARRSIAAVLATVLAACSSGAAPSGAAPDVTALTPATPLKVCASCTGELLWARGYVVDQPPAEVLQAVGPSGGIVFGGVIGGTVDLGDGPLSGS
jgi:hypothetical protein